MNQTKDPSPNELALACLQIQSGWTPDERLRRLRADERPMVRCADDRMVSVSAADYAKHLSGSER